MLTLRQYKDIHDAYRESGILTEASKIDFIKNFLAFVSRLSKKYAIAERYTAQNSPDKMGYKFDFPNDGTDVDREKVRHELNRTITAFPEKYHGLLKSFAEQISNLPMTSISDLYAQGKTREDDPDMQKHVEAMMDYNFINDFKLYVFNMYLAILVAHGFNNEENFAKIASDLKAISALMNKTPSFKDMIRHSRDIVSLIGRGLKTMVAGQHVKTDEMDSAFTAPKK